MNFQNLTIFNQHPDGQQQQMARNENSATKCRWHKNKKQMQNIPSQFWHVHGPHCCCGAYCYCCCSSCCWRLREP